MKNKKWFYALTASWKNLNKWPLSQSLNTQIDWIYAALVSSCWISKQFFEKWVCICKSVWLLTNFTCTKYIKSKRLIFKNVISLSHKCTRQWKLKRCISSGLILDETKKVKGVKCLIDCMVEWVIWYVSQRKTFPVMFSKCPLKE